MGSLQFPPQPDSHPLTHTLSPNSFSSPIFCFHIYFSLNNITITAHLFCALHSSVMLTQQNEGQKKVRHGQITQTLN